MAYQIVLAVGRARRETETHSVVVGHAGVTQAWAHMIMSLLKHANGERDILLFLNSLSFN